jgi:hypothetical protein
MAGWLLSIRSDKKDKSRRNMSMTEGYNNKIEGLAETDSHERRRHSRYPFTATVEVMESKSQTRIQARASDLGRGGCYMDTMSSFPPGSGVKLRLTKGTRSLEIEGEVVYSLDGMGMGVKFTDTDPDRIWTVKKWVGELSGELLPDKDFPSSRTQSNSQERQASKECEVLTELLVELIRIGALSSTKGNAMLQKLNHIQRAKFN